MPELDDSDPPNFNKYVNTQVTLEMLDTMELVQELINREALIVITARRKVPREAYIKDGFYPAMQAVMACDLAKEIQAQELMVDSINQNNTDLEFATTIVVLLPMEDEKPV